MVKFWFPCYTVEGIWVVCMGIIIFFDCPYFFYLTYGNDGVYILSILNEQRRSEYAPQEFLYF